FELVNGIIQSSFDWTKRQSSVLVPRHRLQSSPPEAGFDNCYPHFVVVPGSIANILEDSIRLDKPLATCTRAQWCIGDSGLSPALLTACPARSLDLSTPRLLALDLTASTSHASSACHCWATLTHSFARSLAFTPQPSARLAGRYINIPQRACCPVVPPPCYPVPPPSRLLFAASLSFSAESSIVVLWLLASSFTRSFSRLRLIRRQCQLVPGALGNRFCTVQASSVTRSCPDALVLDLQISSHRSPRSQPSPLRLGPNQSLPAVARAPSTWLADP
ncbi:hypothetical protein CEP53_012458, partial [Fusarium sp. AF-6]